MIITTGATADEFLSHNQLSIRKKFKIPSTAFLILSVGSHQGQKGHKEAVQIFDRAGIVNSVLLIVANTIKVNKKSFKGKAISMIKDLLYKKIPETCPDFCLKAEKYYNKMRSWKVNKKRLIITDISRSETVAAYKDADVFLFPSNIECSPIVLFESNASKTPFLSTDVGNSVEMARWTGGGMILPTNRDHHERSHADIDGSAKMLEQFYSDKKLRINMAESGFKAWKERFTWEAIAEQYELMYKDLLA
jgi:glycosyltransferase involved in cell wall biosynthesis